MACLSERCILAPLNETTRTINGTLVTRLPGESVEYRSLDSVHDKSQAVHFPKNFKLSRGLRISFTYALFKTFCSNNYFTIFKDFIVCMLFLLFRLLNEHER